MGFSLLDQYSLLHFAAGVVAYFWAVPFWWWLAGHALFEYAENTPAGMAAINALPLWPGGKPAADSGRNILGDNLAAAAGWLAAAALDAAMGSPYRHFD